MFELHHCVTCATNVPSINNRCVQCNQPVWISVQPVRATPKLTVEEIGRYSLECLQHEDYEGFQACDRALLNPNSANLYDVAVRISHSKEYHDDQR